MGNIYISRFVFVCLLTIPICALMILIGIIFMELTKYKEFGAKIRRIGYIIGVPCLTIVVCYLTYMFAP